jgi:hypothetical protein
LKDLRAIPGFDYDHYRRALDDLNVEILKRIARREYSHKFDIKVNLDFKKIVHEIKNVFIQSLFFK